MWGKEGLRLEDRLKGRTHNHVQILVGSRQLVELVYSLAYGVEQGLSGGRGSKSTPITPKRKLAVAVSRWGWWGENRAYITWEKVCGCNHSSLEVHKGGHR
jgi:hypothetical protein